MYDYLTFKNARDLPDDWDELAGDNIYLYRNFLTFIEQAETDFDPTYHLFFSEGKADSCFISFPQRGYNLTMFTPFDLKIGITMIYLPMCVTRSGLVLGKRKKDVFDAIKRIKGYKMILNLSKEELPDGYATGFTCPKCILDVEFASFEEYMQNLRSDYRNRYKKIIKRTEEITFRFIDNKTEFSEHLYSLYLNVLNKSRVKIEKLHKEYFMGEMFKVFVAEYNNEQIGFVQLLENGSELIFEFVGVDYKYNPQIPVYHRMLLEIVRYGIENGFKTIDFGQTADEIKLKLGCRYIPLYAALHHSFKPINHMCKMLAPHIEYKPIKTHYRVFKQDTE